MDAVGFPQVMVHPHHRPAVLSNVSANPGDPKYGLPGAPERFPPIEVHNDDQEQSLRAKGYLRYGEAMPKRAEFSEYPKALHHPDHIPAVPPSKSAKFDTQTGQMVPYDVPGKPAVMPDVIVHDEDEEATWEAKGYFAPGHSDEHAFDKATAAPGKVGTEWPKWVDGILMQDPDVPTFSATEYPKWLHFKDGSPAVLVNDPAHEAKVLAARGSQLVQAAEDHLVEPKPYVPLASAPPHNAEYDEFLAWKAARDAQAAETAPAHTDAEADERATLIALAEETGVEIDRRWGLKRLREAVMGAEAAE